MPTARTYRVILAILLSAVGVCIMFFPLGSSRIVGVMAFLVGVIALFHRTKPKTVPVVDDAPAPVLPVEAFRALSVALFETTRARGPFPLLALPFESVPRDARIRSFIPLAAVPNFLLSTVPYVHTLKAADGGVENLFTYLADDAAADEVNLLVSGALLDALFPAQSHGIVASDILSSLYVSGTYELGGTAHDLTNLPPLELDDAAAAGFAQRARELQQTSDFGGAFELLCVIEDIISFFRRARDLGEEASMRALRSSPGYPAILAGFTGIPAAGA